jgi:hypothetical protein
MKNAFSRLGVKIQSYVGAIIGRDARVAARRWANWCLKNKTRFDYTEVSPARWVWVTVILRPTLRLTCDCSAFITGIFKRAGAQDPSLANFAFADTQTMAASKSGKRIPVGKVVAGDVCILGLELPLSGQHTTFVMKGGRDPIVLSMGEQGDPSLIRSSIDSRSKTWVRYPMKTRRATPPKGI